MSCVAGRLRVWGSISLVLMLALWLSAPAPANAAPSKRPVPDYDGRPAPGMTGPEAALWVPRVILFLPWVAYEYVVRRPVGWTLTKLEHSRRSRALIRSLFMGKGTGPLILPLAYYDFGFQPSVGARILWNTAFLAPGSSLSLKFGTWGLDWMRVDFRESLPLAEGTSLMLDAEWWRRPDYVFYGFGPRSSAGAESRYAADRIESRVTVRQNLLWKTYVDIATGLRRKEFRASDCCGTSIEQRVAEGRLDGLPPGYERGGYGIAVTRATLDFDSRRSGRGTGTGLRLQGHLEHNMELGDRSQRWWRYGGRIGVVVHVDPVHERVLDLWLKVRFAEPFGDTEVPFTEQIQLGGSGDLRGFPAMRLVDLSAVAATMSYRWPVAAWVDATMYLGMGNVFGAHLRNFDPTVLRGSVGLGFSLAGLSNERSVQLWAAVGTEPLDEDFGVSTVRLVLGWSYAP